MFQTTQISYANPELYGLSQRCRARLIFKQRCHVTTSSWINIFIHAGLRTGFCCRDLIHESLYTLLHFSSQQRNKFLYFLALLLILSFHSLTLVCCGADKYVDPANELCEWGTAKAIGRNKGEVTIITNDNLFCHIYKRECKCPWWLMLVVEYS